MGVPVPTCRCEVCTSTDPRDRRLRASAWLRVGGRSLLIDTSTDLRAQALAHEIDRVDAVLYTHGHADHILGLDDLRLYNWKQRAPIPVYGNAQALETLRRTFWYVFDGAPTRSTRPAVEPLPIDGPFEVLGVRVVPVAGRHGDLDVLGFRVGRAAYLTDVSALPETSVELLGGLDLLVLNALRERPHPMHLSLREAVDLSRRIGARRTFFTHMSHEVAHARVTTALPDGIELAYDGLEIEVAD